MLIEMNFYYKINIFRTLLLVSEITTVKKRLASWTKKLCAVLTIQDTKKIKRSNILWRAGVLTLNETASWKWQHPENQDMMQIYKAKLFTRRTVVGGGGAQQTTRSKWPLGCNNGVKLYYTCVVHSTGKYIHSENAEISVGISFRI